MGKKSGFRARGTTSQDGDRLSHESYGMVGVSRCHGGGKRKLFGSSLKDHENFISLRIRRGAREHSLSRDWYVADSGPPLIEIHLSAAQFAEMITTMNVSDGVPCTIRYLCNERVDDPPDDTSEVDKVRNGFKEQTGELVKRLAGFRSEVKNLFENKTVSKGDRDEVLKQVDLFIQEVRDNMPFVLDQFEEATEKVVTAAKMEVEAFTTHAVMAAGVESLAARRSERNLLQAPGGQLPRNADGNINNCAIANGFLESECQMCAGICPDRNRFIDDA